MCKLTNVRRHARRAEEETERDEESGGRKRRKEERERQNEGGKERRAEEAHTHSVSRELAQTGYVASGRGMSGRRDSQTSRGRNVLAPIEK